MKKIEELNTPDGLRYTSDHEWVEKKGDVLRVGITDYAQDQLGDIVYVELPQPGDRFTKGEEFGTVESVKAVSELYMPVPGVITAVNKELESSPELVNTAPYTDGWMIEIKPEDVSSEELMDKETYLKNLSEEST